MIVDEDGVGAGVLDVSNGEYKGFMANTSAMENPVTKVKENYPGMRWL
jgi:hypothetical protein